MNQPIDSCEWLRQYPRPWVVVDWGVLRAIPTGAGIPPGFTVVISDIAFLEAATVSRGEREAMTAKLLGLIEHPGSHSRILVGKYWEHVAQQESPLSMPPELESAVEEKSSLEIVDFQRGNLTARKLTYDEPEIGDYERRKSEFVRRVTNFESVLREREPNEWAALASGRILPEQVIDGGPLFMYETLSKFSAEYMTQGWKQALAGFPDRFAVARWMRLIAWYCLQRAVRPDQSLRNLGNNFEDAHYAFLSLYTKRLCTADKGMAAAARALSGGKVRVCGSLEELAEVTLSDFSDS